MIDELADYDTVRVYFDDDSSTQIHVLRNDSIRDKIVELCEDNGWDMNTVINYAIED